ncbi:hypothetical protein P872_12200 [Rhodonellum psychrophilum GCM71 = DSM 17998]|uniref:Uncharacterized protein n=2 Tax=Rhodonellum TaxID=336827 RepID=U5BTI9_9BACT|nr:MULTISPECIES: hypothetical protein [Rhodonellum]ERM80829.1 hypothetical protein P872_12200 [Rhodonellum psychrophilum GCM71 = DSM 17998]MDO9553361.1 hypothetical protein [Rhodonellum sp.]SDZ23908.1 hypothetical protein SAMN05444412_10865 [Rhodonellum ikkaensis]
MSNEENKPKFPFEGSILGLGNGSRAAVLEQPTIPDFPLLNLGKFRAPSDFKIHAPNVKIDPAIIKLTTKVNDVLSKKSFSYNSKIKGWKLSEILASEDANLNTKAKLTRDGFNAVIGDVSSRINRSSTDHSFRFLLSHEYLYVYALSYVIYKEKVKDAAGISERVIITCEREIKPYFNRLLAREVIKGKHLNLQEQQSKKIFEEVAKSNISYLNGVPINAIQKIITKYLNYGNLHSLVDEFFESGGIDPLRGTPQIRQHMVKYLAEIGLKITDQDIEKIKQKGQGVQGGSNDSDDYQEDDREASDFQEDSTESFGG